MNPFKVQKTIKDCEKKGERLIIEELSDKCGVRLRHVHVVMSEDTFESGACRGVPRHWVKGVSVFGWLTLWTYRNPLKDYPASSEGIKLKSYAEIKNKNESDETSEK